MLNRTNRTLSANLNRLNLGTRSLATLAGLNTGIQTLHARHASAVAMRAGMDVDRVDFPFIIGRHTIPSIPGSPSASSWPALVYAMQPEVAVAAEFPAARPGWSSYQPCLRTSEPGRSSNRSDQDCGRVDRKPFQGKGKRRQQGRVLFGSRGRATPSPVAAISAAAGG
jgi:hypothetical protein